MAHKSLDEQLQGLFSDLTELLQETETTELLPDEAGPAAPANGRGANLPVPPRGVAALPTPLPAASTWPSLPVAEPLPSRPGVNWRFIGWSVFGTLVILALLVFGPALLFVTPGEPGAGGQPRFVLPPTPTPLTLPTLTATPLPAAADTAFTFTQATPTPSPVPGGRNLVLTPAARDLGWVGSDDDATLDPAAPPNHLGDSYLYAGVLQGQVYYGALRFDLSRIPRGTHIYAASLRLTGLRADQRGDRGEWRLRLLGPEGDLAWGSRNFAQLQQAAVWSTFAPALTAEELGEGRENRFEFNPEQLRLLERRVLEGSDKFGRFVSFRLDGPAAGPDNLFAWDSGAGPASKGKEAGPQLFLSLGPPPAVTPPPYYVVITSTPTPQTIETAVALSLQMTAQAERIGTATPLPPFWITPVVVTVTPTPENALVATRLAQRATAVALTTGEPPNQATATATPTYVIITSTPTPLSLETAAVQAAVATAAALRYGTATPFPANWVTPAVVVSTPTPENTATVAYWQAVALTTGTPTPTPGNVQTATPTPVLISPTLLPTTTPTPSPTFQPVPAALLGKIIFLSDREGATEAERLRADQARATPVVTPQPYVYDPHSGQVQRLTDLWPYRSALLRDSWSADKRFQVYNQKLLWTNVEGLATEVFAIHVYDYQYQSESQVTRFGRGDAWDPVWSPVSGRLALVANDSGDDEIWVVNSDGSSPLRLTETNEAYNAREIGKDTFIPEVNGHPSWSPDGQQLVFWSNRTGQRQLWLMNADGSDPRLLMPPTPYNDWDPVWVKYQDPPPSLTRQPDWRFLKPETPPR